MEFQKKKTIKIIKNQNSQKIQLHNTCLFVYRMLKCLLEINSLKIQLHWTLIFVTKIKISHENISPTKQSRLLKIKIRKKYNYIAFQCFYVECNDFI